MDNIKLWGEVVNLVADLSQHNAAHDPISPEERIASFVETYKDYFDPADDFKEYVFVRFARAVAELGVLDDMEH